MLIPRPSIALQDSLTLHEFLIKLLHQILGGRKLKGCGVTETLHRRELEQKMPNEVHPAYWPSHHGLETQVDSSGSNSPVDESHQQFISTHHFTTLLLTTWIAENVLDGSYLKYKYHVRASERGVIKSRGFGFSCWIAENVLDGSYLKYKYHVRASERGVIKSRGFGFSCDLKRQFGDAGGAMDDCSDLRGCVGELCCKRIVLLSSVYFHKRERLASNRTRKRVTLPRSFSRASSRSVCFLQSYIFPWKVDESVRENDNGPCPARHLNPGEPSRTWGSACEQASRRRSLGRSPTRKKREREREIPTQVYDCTATVREAAPLLRGKSQHSGPGRRRRPSAHERSRTARVAQAAPASLFFPAPCRQVHAVNPPLPRLRVMRQVVRERCKFGASEAVASFDTCAPPRSAHLYFFRTQFRVVSTCGRGVPKAVSEFVSLGPLYAVHAVHIFEHRSFVYLLLRQLESFILFDLTTRNPATRTLDKVAKLAALERTRVADSGVTSTGGLEGRFKVAKLAALERRLAWPTVAPTRPKVEIEPTIVGLPWPQFYRPDVTVTLLFIGCYSNFVASVMFRLVRRGTVTQDLDAPSVNVAVPDSWTLGQSSSGVALSRYYTILAAVRKPVWNLPRKIGRVQLPNLAVLGGNYRDGCHTSPYNGRYGGSSTSFYGIRLTRPERLNRSGQETCDRVAHNSFNSEKIRGRRELKLKAVAGVGHNFGQKFNLPNASTWGRLTRGTAASNSAMTSECHVHQSVHPCPKAQVWDGEIADRPLLSRGSNETSFSSRDGLCNCAPAQTLFLGTSSFGTLNNEIVISRIIGTAEKCFTVTCYLLERVTWNWNDGARYMKVTVWPIPIQQPVRSKASAFSNEYWRAAVAERLARSPPTWANRVQSQAEPSCRTVLLIGGFSRGSPVSLTLHSGTAPHSPRFTFIGSQGCDNGLGPAHPSEREWQNDLQSTNCRQLAGGQTNLEVLTPTRRTTAVQLKPLLGEVARHWQSSQVLNYLCTHSDSSKNFASTLLFKCSRGGVVVRLLASHHVEPVSIPGGINPGSSHSHVGIVTDDAVGRRVFSGISRFRRPCISALLHTHLTS
ncbi:hypothetical protein PR048_032721 [Dryococelus australis]|uniref:Uncharacterized protein n=1 Tax=Dryococelus australis TaxID=614101 RepID=A0ABQ9G300_9NEOP|nr:hypothetical protein PR048_032721 [Dryococelus australis]